MSSSSSSSSDSSPSSSDETPESPTASRSADDTSSSSNNNNPTGSKSKVGPVTFNLIKAIAGSGVLALPSGLAAMSDTTTSLVPAMTLMTILGLLSAYTFSLYGRLTHISQAHSLGELWEIKKDKSTAWVVSVAALTFCFGACLSYTILLGDVASALSQTLLHGSGGGGGGGATVTGLAALTAGIWTSRQFWILVLTGTVLYPLCRLKSLLALAPLSLAGVGAVLITTLFIAARCPTVNPSSPYLLGCGSKLLRSLSKSQLPLFNTYNKGLTSPSSLVILGMAASAYLGHFTAPEFYHSVKRDIDSSAMTKNEEDDDDDDGVVPNQQALDDFNKVTVGGFLTVTIINCLILACGWLTFGGHSRGVILNNYSTLDVGATICRFLTGVSVVGGFPFLMSACRGELLELWKLRTGHEPTRSDEKKTTKILLLILSLASMVISNAGFVIGFIGSLMGSSIVYIFPSLQFLSYTDKLLMGGSDSSKSNNQSKPKRVRVLRFERMFCRFLVVFGVLAATAGGSVSVINNFFPQMLQ
mmetsp:Transcript_44907/g.109005  ORF Transcript_44907/g.109005 Transcript_44907/m.109005 type:complete len:530 (+) Transcript_44907:266-1855(+)